MKEVLLGLDSGINKCRG